MKHRAILFHYSPCTFIVIVCLWIQLAARACVTLWTLPAGCVLSVRPCSLCVASIISLLFGRLFYLFFYLNLHKCQSIRVLPAGPVPVVLLAARLKTDWRNACWHFLAFIIRGNAGKLQRAEILTHLSRICEQGRKSVGSNMIVLSMESGKWKCMGGSGGA